MSLAVRGSSPRRDLVDVPTADRRADRAERAEDDRVNVIKRSTRPRGRVESTRVAVKTTVHDRAARDRAHSKRRAVQGDDRADNVLCRRAHAGTKRRQRGLEVIDYVGRERVHNGSPGTFEAERSSLAARSLAPKLLLWTSRREGSNTRRRGYRPLHPKNPRSTGKATVINRGEPHELGWDLSNVSVMNFGKRSRGPAPRYEQNRRCRGLPRPDDQATRAQEQDGTYLSCVRRGALRAGPSLGASRSRREGRSSRSRRRTAPAKTTRCVRFRAGRRSGEITSTEGARPAGPRRSRNLGVAHVRGRGTSPSCRRPEPTGSAPTTPRSLAATAADERLFSGRRAPTSTRHPPGGG